MIAEFKENGQERALRRDDLEEGRVYFVANESGRIHSTRAIVSLIERGIFSLPKLLESPLFYWRSSINHRHCDPLSTTESTCMQAQRFDLVLSLPKTLRSSLTQSIYWKPLTHAALNSLTRLDPHELLSLMITQYDHPPLLTERDQSKIKTSQHVHSPNLNLRSALLFRIVAPIRSLTALLHWFIKEGHFTQSSLYLNEDFIWQESSSRSFGELWVCLKRFTHTLHSAFSCRLDQLECAHSIFCSLDPNFDLWSEENSRVSLVSPLRTVLERLPYNALTEEGLSFERQITLITQHSQRFDFEHLRVPLLTKLSSYLENIALTIDQRLICLPLSFQEAISINISTRLRQDHRAALTPSMLREVNRPPQYKRFSTPWRGGLFFLDRQYGIDLALTLAKQQGPKLISNIHVAHPKSSDLSELWLFNDEAILKFTLSLADELSKSFDGDPNSSGHVEKEPFSLPSLKSFKRFIEMRPLDFDKDPLTPRSRFRVWLPKGMYLKPMPSQDALKNWVKQSLDTQQVQTLDFLPSRLGSAHRNIHDLLLLSEESMSEHASEDLCDRLNLFEFDLDECHPLSDRIDFMMTSQRLESHDPLDFLEERLVSFTSTPVLDLKSMHREVDLRLINQQSERSEDPQALYGETAVEQKDLITIQEKDPLNSPGNSEPDVPLKDTLHREIRLRDTLKKISRPEVKRSPKMLARQWLSELSTHVPLLLSGAHASQEWRHLAHQLWVTERYDRAIEALCWSMIDHFLERVNSNGPQNKESDHLSGWRERLSKPLPTHLPDSELNEYTRIALLTLFDEINESPLVRSQTRTQAKTQTHSPLTYLRMLQEGDDVPLPQLSIISARYERDLLYFMRRREWVSRQLAIGLSPRHCDPLIERCLKEDSLNLNPNDERTTHTSPDEDSLRAWGRALAEALAQRTQTLKVLSEQERLVLSQYSTALMGMIELLNDGEGESHLNANSRMSDPLKEYESSDSEFKTLILSQYRVSSSNVQMRGLSRLRASSQCSFWCQHSTLNLRAINATPLGVSKASRSRLSSTEELIEANKPQGSIPLESLKLKLDQLIRSLRPHVRSYFSLRDALLQAVNQSLGRFDKLWLESAIKAFESWSEELITIPTAPPEVASQIDLERIRMISAIEPNRALDLELGKWSQRWLTSNDKQFSWRQRLRFYQEFALRGIPQALSYGSHEQLSILIEEALIALDLARQSSIKEANQHLEDINLESASTSLSLCASLDQLRGSSMPHLRFIEASERFSKALITWVEAYESRGNSKTAMSFKPPLSAWLYQLNPLSTQQRKSLSTQLMSAIGSSSIETQTRCWFVIEDALLSTPLFDQSERPYLDRWLRSRERALRAYWRLQESEIFT